MHRGDQFGVVMRLARDAERQAGDRLRAAQERCSAAEARLGAVEAYLAEYQSRAAGLDARAARDMLDQRRFLGQLQQTVALQVRITEQDRRHVELVRGQWLAARKKREALEALVAERDRRAAMRVEQQAQQAQDDRPRGQNPGLHGLGPVVA